MSSRGLLLAEPARAGGRHAGRGLMCWRLANKQGTKRDTSDIVILHIPKWMTDESTTVKERWCLKTNDLGNILDMSRVYRLKVNVSIINHDTNG